jgi:hypothetical protein
MWWTQRAPKLTRFRDRVSADRRVGGIFTPTESKLSDWYVGFDSICKRIVGVLTCVNSDVTRTFSLEACTTDISLLETSKSAMQLP